MSLREQSVEYHDGDVELRGLLVAPDHGAERPGVLVVHGGAGLDDHARARARQIADLGLVVFACDMYGKGVVGDRDRVMASIKKLVGDREKLSKRALAGINVLASDRSINGVIAAVGYCFGGRTVLELARSGADLCGVISVHGSLEQPTQPAQARSRPRSWSVTAP